MLKNQSQVNFYLKNNNLYLIIFLSNTACKQQNSKQNYRKKRKTKGLKYLKTKNTFLSIFMFKDKSKAKTAY